jgi:hypothetical protein
LLAAIRRLLLVTPPAYGQAGLKSIISAARRRPPVARAAGMGFKA